MFVNNFLHLCEYPVRRQHLPELVRAVYSDEIRIQRYLLPVDRPHLLLELYV